MTTLLGRAHRGLLFIVAGLMAVSLFSPMIAMASTDLTAGEQAIVANPGGSGANLRRSIDSLDDANVIAELPQGATVTIGEGPIVNDAGTWFWVTSQDNTLTGYVEASLLSRANAAPQTDAATQEAPNAASATETPETPVGLPWQEPIDFGFVVDNNNEIPADGLACRVDASVDAEVITRLPESATLEIVSARIWQGDTSFIQVNCGGVSGFVNGAYVVTQSEQVAAEPTEEVVETEVPTEVVVPTVEVEVPTVEVPTVEVEVPTVEVPTVEVEVPTVEVPTVEVELPTVEVPADVVVPTVEVPTVEVEVPTIEVPTVEVEQPTVEAPTEVVVPTVEVEVPTIEVEVPTIEVPTEVVVPTVEVPTEVVTETAEDDQITTEEATEVVTETPTEVVTETPAEVVTESATDVVTEAPTEAITETPTDEPSLAAQAATEEVPAGPAADISAAIGTATVTGTQDGLRCRVAPSGDAATIMVLEEGTKVYVLEEATDGYLKIECGGQEGYADVTYLWAGGASDEELPKSSGASIVVSGTGNGLNCRTGAGTNNPVITVVYDGTVLQTRGAASNGWIPVVCGGQDGFVATQYVENTSSAPAPSGGDTTGGASGGFGTITGTGGDGVRCRTGAGTSYSVITVLAEGSIVGVRGAAQGSWTPVTCGGTAGWVHSDYVTGVGSNGTPAPNPGSGNSNGGGATSGTVTVTGTGGGGLNCRTGASTGSGVITVLAEGSSVAATGAASNGWQPVSCGGQNGFVSTQYVTSGGSAPAPTNPTNPPAGSDGGSAVTGSATVSGTNGDGVRCRTGAGTGSSVITVLAEGTTVSTRGNASNGWVPVVCGGQNGFVSAEYLTIGGGTNNPAPTPTPDPVAPSGMVSGDHAKVTSDLNLRYEPSLGSSVATFAPAGTVVLITGSASNGFYPVDWDGLRGYMSGDYLTKTSEALSERGGSANPGTDNPAPGGGGTATGNALVDYAMNYLGYPYVWATHGPASFDCSGFTYWVVKNVLGIDIGTGTWTQVSSGVSVSRDALQPGDLVFFQNTYTSGLSHVGMYIGNGQFIHAQNEQTGVVISDLSSSYYASRWYGARRLV